MHTITIAPRFDAFRVAARRCLAAGRAPHELNWVVEGDSAGLFDAPGSTQPPSTNPDAASDATSASVPVPRKVLALLRRAAACREPDRWALLYQVLWRFSRGDRAAVSAADADGARLDGMARRVAHELHRMHAFVRFIERPPQAGNPRFLAWYEPEHDILEEGAEHFARRMGRDTWMIATPDGTACWDGAALAIDPRPATRPPASGDEAQTLWLAYYAHIFNPARVNASAMEMHMPVRYWKLMPEAALIPGLLSDAGAGARRVGEARTIRRDAGAVIAIEAERAQPRRAAPRALDACRRCALWQNATQAVSGEGPAHAAIMLVGEQPGDQEDLNGRAFIGPAGQLLDRAFAQASLDRSAVYLTNAVKHFKWEPRGKRRLHKTPAQREVAACAHWLEEELAAVKPRVVVALGATALKALAGPAAKLADHLDHPVHVDGRWLVATYHPAYALRAPDARVQHEAFGHIAATLEHALGLARDAA
jgi:probable DNA metabolism protein